MAEAKIKLNDEELENVAGGEKVMHIVKRPDGKYNLFAAEWSGDIKAFLSLFNGAELKELSVSVGIETSKGLREKAFQERRDDYIKQGYKIV